MGVRLLPRLHAKVLWVDKFLVSVGSHNFTKHARTSKETTGFHIENWEIESLHLNLARWLSDSDPVSFVFLCELIDSLAVKSRDKVKAHTALVQAFHEQMETHEAQIELIRKNIEAERRQRLADLQEQSKLRLGQPRLPAISYGNAMLITSHIKPGWLTRDMTQQVGIT